MSIEVEPRPAAAAGRSVLDFARDYHAAGLSVIPVRLDGSKAPALPAGHPVLLRRRRATEAELTRWFGRGRRGIAVQCGAISGNVECIDFEDPDAYAEWYELVCPLLPDRIDRLCHVRTPRPGFHVWYRCAAPPGPGKVLARTPPGPDGKPRTLIETRAEGHYVVAPGSPPAVHPNGTPYHWEDGGGLTELPVLTPEERSTLTEAAVSLNRYDDARASSAAGPGGRPGDDYNARGPDWREVLGRAGWECVREAGGVRHWRRPGKEGRGASATTGRCTGPDGADLLYVFSTNAEPFRAGQGYSKFRAYAALYHGGDLSAAARELASQGYGGDAPRAGPRVCPAPLPPRPREQAFTAAELAGMVLPPPRWAVPDLIPEGFTILAGRPKTGKSWLALHLAVEVAAGGRVLGTTDVEPGPVLYLALEDTRRRLQKRLAALCGPDRPAPASLHLRTAWRPLDHGGVQDLAEECASLRPRLVVIDTLARLRGRGKPGENAYAADYEFIGILKSIADNFGAAVVGLHHTSKTARADPLDEVSGTLGLTGAADTTVILKRERGTSDATLFVTGRDVEERELAVTADAAACVWQNLGDAEGVRLSRQRREALDVLATRPDGLRPRELAELLGKPANAVRVMLYRMHHAGEVEADGPRYKAKSITPVTGG